MSRQVVEGDAELLVAGKLQLWSEYASRSNVDWATFWAILRFSSSVLEWIVLSITTVPEFHCELDCITEQCSGCSGVALRTE
jgi:hypothetical protein